jgi:hypothetical protein
MARLILWKCLATNFVILILLAPLIFVSDVVYEIHGNWFQGSKEEFSVYIYYVISFYKMLVIFFNLVPYIALRMIEDEST